MNTWLVFYVKNARIGSLPLTEQNLDGMKTMLYNNASFYEMYFVETQCLYANRCIINEFFDNQPVVYQYRVGTSYFISYFERFHKQIDPAYLKEMLAIDAKLPVEGGNRQRNGFYSWLLTSSYRSGGALRDYKRDWNYYEFITGG